MASRDILNLESRKCYFQGLSRGIFHCGRHVVSSEHTENTRKTGNNAVEMSQAFHNIAWFERLTDLNLFKYAFNVAQNWQMDALQFYSMVLIFGSSYGRRRSMKVAI